MANIYLPPIARKKKVDGYPRQDSSRVFSDLQGSGSQSKTSYDTHFIGHSLLVSSRQSALTGQNKPHPTKVTFLRQNPRFICEPICHVETATDSPPTFPTWWPNEIPEKPAKIPKHSFDSTSRTDYRPPPLLNDRVMQYSSNLAMQVTPLGILPQGHQHTSISSQASQSSGADAPKVVEKISYEHQFNSRLDPSHPIRGRRHGSFIWKVASDVGKQNKKCSNPSEQGKQDKATDANSNGARDLQVKEQVESVNTVDAKLSSSEN